MSDNKNKYFVVTQVSVVSAPNMTEALRAARNSRRSGTKVLSHENQIERVSASSARSLAGVETSTA